MSKQEDMTWLPIHRNTTFILTQLGQIKFVDLQVSYLQTKVLFLINQHMLLKCPPFSSPSSNSNWFKKNVIAVDKFW